MQDALARLMESLSNLTVILLDPGSNLKAAYPLYGSIGLVLLIVLVIGILVVMRSTKEDEVSGEETLLHEGQSEASAKAARAPKPPRAPLNPRARLAVALGIVLVFVAAWMITGYTTSNPALCKSCHWPAAEHAKAPAGTDPHTRVSCISCHESGGILGRYLAGVPARLVHFGGTQFSVPQQKEYGRVTAAACSSCHGRDLVGVATNEKRGLKVSHKEPMAASATCVDCHALRAGVVGVHNAGMGPCLRCHDAKQASAECSTCHDEKAASAARARTASFADVQIPNVSCGGCHNEKRECDSCHGVRLPHSTEFKAYAHARAGVADLWYNGGKTCSRCHTASRRPCQRCHTSLFGRGHGAGLANAHQTASASACNTCHLQFAYVATRDFCKDLCHSPAAVESSPR